MLVCRAEITQHTARHLRCSCADRLKQRLDVFTGDASIGLAPVPLLKVVAQGAFTLGTALGLPKLLLGEVIEHLLERVGGLSGFLKRRLDRLLSDSSHHPCRVLTAGAYLLQVAHGLTAVADRHDLSVADRCLLQLAARVAWRAARLVAVPVVERRRPVLVLTTRNPGSIVSPTSSPGLSLAMSA